MLSVIVKVNKKFASFYSPICSSHAPPTRDMCLQLRTSPETGRTELVVLSGYANALLANMRPYSLDVATMVWASHPGQAPPKGPGFSLPLPPGRQRAASYQVLSRSFDPRSFVQLAYPDG